MLQSYDQLIGLINTGVITGVPDLANVNGSSIDITLGADILIEDIPTIACPRCMERPFSDKASVPRGRSGFKAYVTCPNALCGYAGPLSSYIKPVDFSKKESLCMKSHSCAGENGFTLWPGEVCLAHSVEIFNLPEFLTAEYRLKSSMGRVFLEHMHAGWCGPGWHGSVLTLEFKNETQYHPLILRAGMKCGQVMFYSHQPVPQDRSYAVRGQYNNDITATPSKGLR